MRKRTGFVLLALLALAPLAGLKAATSFTPLEWQQVVRKHANKQLIGQRKFTTWIRDKDRNFIDDNITERFHSGELVDIIVDLNTCLPPEQLKHLLAPFGHIQYVEKLITAVLMQRVRFDDLSKLAALPEVAMIEWQQPMFINNDVSNRAIQARSSVTFSTNTAEDHGFTGTGVTVGIVDTGVDLNHEAFAGKFVAGFDATNPMDPGDGTTQPPDNNGHGTHVAGTVLGLGTAGRNCRTPDDGSPTNCQGVAPGAKLVVVKVCTTNQCPNLAQGLDWLAVNAAKFNVRAANVSIGGCTEDDGLSALAQQANYLAAIGVAIVLSHGNSPNCGVAAGTQLNPPPGSASFGITVQASDDQGTVRRTDDTIATFFLMGPRTDFNLMNPDLLALKPDITAPGTNIFSATAGTTNAYHSLSGTSQAAPHVTGAAADIIQARPDIDPGSLKDLLLRNADSSRNFTQGGATFPAVDPVWNSSFGYGLLNVWAALNAAGQTDVGFPNCVSPSATPGGLCGLTPPMPPWDNTADITTATPPQANVPNTITAQVKNFGAVPATVLVNFGVYEFAVGNNQFFHVGTVQVTIPAGATVPVNQAWTPAAANHQCVQVSIQFGLDTNYGNNLTQRNLSVAPSVFEVRVENPFMVPAKFEARAKSQREGWKCEVDQAAFVLDAFSCPRKMRVAFNAPKGTRAGDHADCDIAVFATPEGGKTQLIGGVTAQTIVPKPCRFVGTVVGTNGQPIPEARLVFEINDPEIQEGQAAYTAKAGTDADGNFEVTLTPFRHYRVMIERPGVGKGEVAIQPMCGICLRFVLSREKAEMAD
jgi:hypothetical protein